MGFRTSVARSTLADANESRDWRIYADFAQTLIATARVETVADRTTGSERSPGHVAIGFIIWHKMKVWQ
jgi:hypothetical protein